MALGLTQSARYFASLIISHQAGDEVAKN